MNKFLHYSIIFLETIIDFIDICPCSDNRYILLLRCMKAILVLLKEWSSVSGRNKKTGDH